MNFIKNIIYHIKSYFYFLDYKNLSYGVTDIGFYSDNSFDSQEELNSNNMYAKKTNNSNNSNTPKGERYSHLMNDDLDNDFGKDDFGNSSFDDPDDWINQISNTRKQLEQKKTIDTNVGNSPVAKKQRLINMANNQTKEEIKSLENTESQEYLRHSLRGANTPGIFSGPVKFISILIGILVVILFFVGNYLNTSNPLIPLMNLTSKPFAINVLDKNNIKIFGITTINTSRDSLRIPTSLTYSLIALHSILEMKMNEKAIAPDKVALSDVMNTSSTLDVSKVLGGPSSDSPTADMNDNSSSEQSVTDNTKGSSSILEKTCKVYNTPEEFANYNCMYSYTSFLINYMAMDKSQESSYSFVSNLINSSDIIKTNLLLGWLKSNVTPVDFFNLYFTYVNFGFNSIGVELAAKRYFDKKISALTIGESIYLVLKAYQNNTTLYKTTTPIMPEEIISRLQDMGFSDGSEPSMILKNINNIIEKNENNPFTIYLDDIFNLAYSRYTSNKIVNIQTSFAISTQNSLLGLVKNEIFKSKIPNGAAFLINKTNLVAGFSIGVKNISNPNEQDNVIFYKSLPSMRMKNGLKPFLYYSLIDNYMTPPPLLLSKKYQNFIFSYDMFNIYKKSETDSLPELNQGEEIITVKDGIMDAYELNKAQADTQIVTNDPDLDVAPEFFRKKFAYDVSKLEEQMFNKMPFEKYIKTLSAFKLPTDTNSDTITNLLDYNLRVNILDILNAYSTFANEGNIYTLKYMQTLNNTALPFNSQPLSNVSIINLDILKNSLFNSIAVSKDKSIILYYIIDANYAVLFSSKYTLVVWLGDLGSDSLPDKNYSKSLFNIIQGMAFLLQN